MGNVIQVVRYIRPGKKYAPFNELFEVFSNMFGVTIVFEMNYDTREVVARWAVCADDNFTKSFGIERAQKSTISRKFLIDEINGGLINTLFNKLISEIFPDDEYENHVEDYSYEEIHKIFLKPLLNNHKK